MTKHTKRRTADAAPPQAAAARASRSVESKDVLAAFPLSPAQERMWRADQERPGNPAYNLSFRWNLEGELDPLVLERSFNEILRRHEILRARITQIGDDPVQLIPPTTTSRISITDLRSLPEPQRELEMDRLCEEEATRSFDLKQGPLMRVGLLRLQDKQHVLMLTVHHIVSDGWSIGVIMRDVQRIYAEFVEGRESSLEELTLQYADYVIWLQQRAQDEDVQRHFVYWRAKIGGWSRLEIGTDFPRPAERTVNGAIVSRLLARELADALSAYCSREGMTMFTTTLAACLALLHRYSGKTDVAVGSALAGRERIEIEGLVGPFMNQIVLRADAAGDPTFHEFAARVRDTVWEAVANQNVPFERVIEAIRTGDKPWSEPFFVINFNCHRAYGGSSALSSEFCGIRTTPIPSKSQGTLYDLNFFLIEREGVWRASLEFNSDLYAEARARRIIDNFYEMLQGVVADPTRRLSEFTLSAIGEEASLKRPTDQVDVPRAPPPSSTEEDDPNVVEAYALPASVVQERFWLLAKVSPDSAAFHMTATVRLSGSLSIGALERSFSSLIERHEILRTTFKVIDGELAQVVSPAFIFSLPVTDLESLPPIGRDFTELLSDEARQPFDLVRGPLFRARLFRERADSHVLLVTLHHIVSDGWSQGILQDGLWLAYEALSGNRQVSLPPLSIQYGDFAAWQRDWLNTNEALEHLDFWTRRLRAPLPVLDFPTDRPPNKRPAPRGAIETQPVAGDLMQALKDLSQSEGATIFMLMLASFAILLSRYSGQDDVLIGSPVANRRAETESLIGPFAGPFALRIDLSGNPKLRDVLTRVRDVTMEALNHTDLPFETLLERLKARSINGRNPLFQFYFLYQKAFLQPRELSQLTVTPMPPFSVGTPFELQLSIIERPQGVRINLEYNPDLFDAATIRELLRYYEHVLRALASNPEQLVDELKAAVRHRVGEVAAPTSRVHEYVAPRNPTEVRLTQIWEKLFEVPRIGVHDNFFDLGGHSLLAAQLFAAVEREFGTTINLSMLIVAPTIEDLSKKLQSGTDESHLIPLKASGTKPPLFCIHSAGGHVLRYRDMASVMDEDQPLYGLSAPELDGAHVTTTVEELAAKYIRDVRKLCARGPYRLCGLSFGGLVAYEMATRLVREGEVVDVLALFDTGNPAYYRRLPPSRSMKFRATYLIARLGKYGQNLAHGRIEELLTDAHQFLVSRADALVWRVVQAASRALSRPVPKRMRDNVIMFTAVGRAYTPKLFPGRLLLFRARGRTAEYGDDTTLGWQDVAQGSIRVHHVAGDHMTIMRTPYVADLVEQLSPYLTPVSCSNDDASKGA